MITGLAKAVSQDNSDAAVMVRYLQAPIGNKPELSDNQMKKVNRTLHAQTLLYKHKVAADVAVMIQTIYNLKSVSQAFEIIRNAEIVNGAITSVVKSARRKFYLDWCDEQLKRYQEQGDNRAFNDLMKLVMKEHEGEDPDMELLLRAQPHNYIITVNPEDAGFIPLDKEKKERLKQKYLGYATKTAEQIDAG